MAGQIRIRASFKKPTRPMAHAVSILSAFGTALALESVLSCAICIRTQAQTTTLSVVSNGQSQLPGGLAGPTLNPANQPQGLAVPSHNAQPPSSVTSAMPGNAAGLKHRVTRGVGITSKPVSSTLCFQPGVGWIQRSLPPDTAGRAFQTVPFPLLFRSARAKTLVGTVDAEDCSASFSPIDASLASLLAGTSQRSTPSAQSNGAAMNRFVTANLKPGTSRSSSTSNVSGSAGALTAVLPQAGSAELSYSYFDALGSTPLSIRPSVSRTGDLEFSIASPEVGLSDSQAVPEDTVVEIPIYSFHPGGNSSASGLGSESKLSHVTWGALNSERNGVIGHESSQLRSQESSAATEVPILAKDLHAYRQLRLLCLKVVEMQQAGGAADLAGTNLVSGHNATELARLREDCGELLAMNRNALIRKMQKHKGLK